MYSDLKQRIHTPNLYKVKGRCNKFGYNAWTKYIHMQIG